MHNRHDQNQQCTDFVQMSKTVHLCHRFKEENYAYFCIILDNAFLKIFCTLSDFVLSDKHSPFTANSKEQKKRKEKIRKLYSAQSVKSFFFPNQNLINSTKSVHLCTLTYYTHLVYLHNSAMHVCLCCTCVLVTFLSLPRHAVIREYQICCMRPHTWDWSSSQCIP